MNFNQLRLLVAISKLGSLVPDKSVARREYVFAVRDEYCRMNEDCHFPFTESEVSDLAVDYRKQKTTRTKADIAAAYGVQCFWRHRGKGTCSVEAEGGHILLACEGNELTVANGLIECRRHNRDRGTKSIEEYLKCQDIVRIEGFENENSPVS